MNTKLLSAALFVAAGVLATSGYCWAAPIETTWVFRSPVVENQSMWGAGMGTSFKFSEAYEWPAWPFKGTGFGWALEANSGTVSGNVEGNLKAAYDSVTQNNSTTTINFCYTGIADESRIRAGFGASLSAIPRIKFDLEIPLVPGIDWSIPVSMLNAGVFTAADYTTGLGHMVTATGKYDALPFGVDLALFSGYLNIGLDQDIAFTASSITGTVLATHFATGATRTAPLTLLTDGTVVPVNLNLDLLGGWDIQLNDFSVDQNSFHQDLGLGARLGFKVPLLGVDLAIDTDSYWDLWNTTFSLEFDNHNADGDPVTTDNLGRFCLYVESIPEPSTMALLGAGCLLFWRRKR